LRGGKERGAREEKMKEKCACQSKQVKGALHSRRGKDRGERPPGRIIPRKGIKKGKNLPKNQGGT